MGITGEIRLEARPGLKITDLYGGSLKRLSELVAVKAILKLLAVLKLHFVSS